MDAQRWRQYIGGWELIAGATGVVVTLAAVGRVPRMPGVLSALASMGIVSAVSAVAGYALVRRRRFGRVLSLWALGPQVLGFNVGFATWHLLLGPYFQLRLVLPTSFGFDAGMTVNGTVWFGETGANAFFTLNVAAFAAFIYLVGQPDLLDPTPAAARATLPDAPSAAEAS